MKKQTDSPGVVVRPIAHPGQGAHRMKATGAIYFNARSIHDNGSRKTDIAPSGDP